MKASNRLFIDVTYHRKLHLKYATAFNSRTAYQKLKDVIITRDIRKENNAYRTEGFIQKVCDDGYKPKYRMEC